MVWYYTDSAERSIGRRTRRTDEQRGFSTGCIYIIIIGNTHPTLGLAHPIVCYGVCCSCCVRLLTGGAAIAFDAVKWYLSPETERLVGSCISPHKHVVVCEHKQCTMLYDVLNIRWSNFSSACTSLPVLNVSSQSVAFSLFRFKWIILNR